MIEQTAEAAAKLDQIRLVTSENDDTSTSPQIISLDSRRPIKVGSARYVPDSLELVTQDIRYYGELWGCPHNPQETCNCK